MKITIAVTQGDIDDGCRGNAVACPVARAAARILDARHLSVRTKVLEFTEPLLLIPLPAAAVKFIRQFDSRAHVEPFSFDVNVPEDLMTP